MMDLLRVILVLCVMELKLVVSVLVRSEEILGLVLVGMGVSWFLDMMVRF